MIEKIQEKVEEFRQEKEIYEFNERELTKIMVKLKNNKDMLEVEKNYLQVFFD